MLSGGSSTQKSDFNPILVIRESVTFVSLNFLICQIAIITPAWGQEANEKSSLTEGI